jgi:hypothetical protein
MVQHKGAFMHVPLAIFKVLFFMCIPLVVYVLLLLLEITFRLIFTVLIRGYCMHATTAPGYSSVGLRALVQQVVDRVLLCAATLAFVVIFFFYPSLVRINLSMFACVPIDSPNYQPYGIFTASAAGSFWLYDIDQPCWQGYHGTWALALGLPCLVLLCLGLPSFLAIFLWSYRCRLQQPSFVKHFGFLYIKYRQERCWWEVMVMMETLTLVAIAVFGLTLGPYYQGLVMNAGFAIILVLLLMFKPFQSQQQQQLSLLANSCLLFTSYVSLSFLDYGTIDPGDTYQTVVGAVLVALNTCFLLYACILILLSLDWQFIRYSVGCKWRAVRAFLRSRLQTQNCCRLWAACSPSPPTHTDSSYKAVRIPRMEARVEPDSSADAGQCPAEHDEGAILDLLELDNFGPSSVRAYHTRSHASHTDDQCGQEL